MRAIIHTGMHKTGTSSIQSTLAGCPIAGLYYPDWSPAGNHSPLASLLFEEDVETFQGFAATGRTREELTALKEKWGRRITGVLAAGEHDRVVLSAERIDNFSAASAARMKEFFAPYCDTFQVVTYVRPPVSALTSAFQQQLKGGTRTTLDLPWPLYRHAIEKLDRVFGRANVTLKIFRPEALTGGDVVTDFAAEIGATIPPERIQRVNESLSLEAVALLYAQRRLGRGFVQGFKRATAANNRFIKVLSEIGRAKLVFAPSLIDPLIDRHREDLDWIEARLGTPILDRPAETARAIATEDDLLAVAEEQSDALAALLAARLTDREAAPATHLVPSLEVLRTLTREAPHRRKSRAGKNRPAKA